jgi:Zn finger protein HypA/HybF involved in hydrogenase expression
MSIRFDAKVTCNGCGTPRDDGAALEFGGQRVSDVPVKGGREVIATVAKECPVCGSTRVKIVARAGLIRG